MYTKMPYHILYMIQGKFSSLGVRVFTLNGAKTACSGNLETTTELEKGRMEVTNFFKESVKWCESFG